MQSAAQECPVPQVLFGAVSESPLGAFYADFWDTGRSPCTQIGFASPLDLTGASFAFNFEATGTAFRIESQGGEKE
jgi:hypothetical protein